MNKQMTAAEAKAHMKVMAVRLKAVREENEELLQENLALSAAMASLEIENRRLEEIARKAGG